MTRLEDLTPTTAICGSLLDVLVAVTNVQWFGSEALELTYKKPDGRVASKLIPSTLQIVKQPCRRSRFGRFLAMYTTLERAKAQ